MDWQTLFFTSYELFLSLVFGLLTIYVTTKFLNFTFLHSARSNLLLENNTAIAIFAGTMIFCVMLLVHGSVLPAVEALRTMVLGGRPLGLLMVVISLGYFAVFYVIALAISVAILYLATQVYLMATTNIDEIAEIRRNKVSVAILVAAVVLAMTLFVRPASQRFISSLIDWQSLERIGTEEPAPAAGEDGQLAPRPGPSPD